jgi:hypothetical protein
MSQVQKPSFSESVERLQHAVGVMENLTDTERALFTIHVFAIQTGDGLKACAAGHCGLKPWFQERGLCTTVAPYIALGEQRIGSLSVPVKVFFGTSVPFFLSYYVCYRPSVDDVIESLNREIAKFQYLADTTPAEDECCPGPVTVIFSCDQTFREQHAGSLVEARLICLEWAESDGRSALSKISIRDANGLDHRPTELWGAHRGGTL